VRRLEDRIAELAGFNDDPAGGGITREVYTPTYAAALDRVAGWMAEAGLETRDRKSTRLNSSHNR
jgi:hypothetical protein